MNNSSGVIRYQDSWGPNRISLSSEGAASPEASQVKGYHTVLAPRYFKRKMSTTWEMARHNDYPQIANYAKDLGKAMIETINAEGAGIIIGCQNTAITAYGDTLPLASTVHTRPDGKRTNCRLSEIIQKYIKTLKGLNCSLQLNQL